MAARQGFEPRFIGSEPMILPLDDLAIIRDIISNKLLCGFSTIDIFVFWDIIVLLS